MNRYEIECASHSLVDRGRHLSKHFVEHVDRATTPYMEHFLSFAGTTIDGFKILVRNQG